MLTRFSSIFELDIVKTIIMTKFQHGQVKNMASGVFNKIVLQFGILTQHNKYMNLALISSRQTFWQGLKLLRQKKDSGMFSSIWPSDLYFDWTWHIFKHSLDIIKTISLTRFQYAQIKNATSRVSTRLSFNLIWYPSFAHIWTWHRYQQYKHTDKVSSCWSKKCWLMSVINFA